MKGFIIGTDVTETLGLEVIAGRRFPEALSLPDDSTRTGRRYLLSETAVEALGWSPREAVGKRLSTSGPEGHVLGVVKDFHFASFHASIEPMAFWYHPDRARHLLVRLAPGQTKATLAHLEKQWAAAAPQQPFQYRFLDDTFAALCQNEQRAGQVFCTFALLAVLVACLGLFGLAALVALLSKDFLKLVVGAVVLAVPLAWWVVQRWLEGFGCHVNLGPWVFAAASGLALLVALAPTSYQALRAARANPAEALRDE